jgi:hypothetical protein
MKKKKPNKIFVKLLILLGILVAIFLILILINLKFFKLFNREIKTVQLLDRCSILFETIVHSIKDESGCETSCRAECIVREIEFYKSEFSEKIEGCNSCVCYCR